MRYLVMSVGKKGKLLYEETKENPYPVFIASCEKK